MSVVLIFNLGNFHAVVVEQEGILGVEAVFEIVSVEDSFELSQELKRVFNRSDVLKVLVNVNLELSLDS